MQGWASRGTTFGLDLAVSLRPHIARQHAVLLVCSGFFP